MQTRERKKQQKIILNKTFSNEKKKVLQHRALQITHCFLVSFYTSSTRPHNSLCECYACIEMSFKP